MLVLVINAFSCTDPAINADGCSVPFREAFPPCLRVHMRVSFTDQEILYQYMSHIFIYDQEILYQYMSHISIYDQEILCQYMSHISICR